MTSNFKVHLLLAALLVCGVAATPASSSIETTSRSSGDEECVFPIVAAEPDVLRFPNQGATLGAVRGMKVSIRATLELTALSAEAINNDDAPFVRTLSARERITYFRQKRNYRGGLDVPMLLFVGINLDQPVTRADLESSAASQPNYNAKAAAVKEILENTPVRTSTNDSNLSGRGIGVSPAIAVAEIQDNVARIYFEDGTSHLISGKRTNSAPPPSTTTTPGGFILL